jgi:hypothetical protein
MNISTHSSLLATACALLLLGSGCTFGFDIDYVPDEVAPAPPPEVEWTEVQAGVHRMEYPFGDDRFDVMVMYRLAPTCCTYSLDTSTEPRDLDAWAEAHPDALLLANAAYFHEDLSPSGMLISKGARVGERSFDLDKSGLIVLDPQVQILDTAVEKFTEASLNEAFQSYPFLIKNGEIAITGDSGLSARRTFFGTDTAGNTYVGILHLTDLSLFRLAHVLSEMDISWKHAINLDGGPSTGLIMQRDGRSEHMDSLTPVGSVIVVEAKD